MCVSTGLAFGGQFSDDPIHQTWDAIVASFPQVWRGFLVNMRIVDHLAGSDADRRACACSSALPDRAVAAPLRVAAIIFIDLFRGLPSLLLVLLFGLGVPALQPPGVPSSSLFWGTVALIVGYSAYTAEVYRSGMEAIHDCQRAASRALGLSQRQMMRFAIIPQAVRNVLPALVNLAVALQKDVVLLSVIGVRAAVREARIYTAETLQRLEPDRAAALFLFAGIPLARFTDWVQRRDQQRRASPDVVMARRLEVQHLTKHYGETLVLNDVSLAVDEH